MHNASTATTATYDRTFIAASVSALRVWLGPAIPSERMESIAFIATIEDGALFEDQFHRGAHTPTLARVAGCTRTLVSDSVIAALTASFPAARRCILRSRAPWARSGAPEV